MTEFAAFKCISAVVMRDICETELLPIHLKLAALRAAVTASLGAG